MNGLQCAGALGIWDGKFRHLWELRPYVYFITTLKNQEHGNINFVSPFEQIQPKTINKLDPIDTYQFTAQFSYLSSVNCQFLDL